MNIKMNSITRPRNLKKYINEGSYIGTIVYARLKVQKVHFNKGEQLFLSIKIIVHDSNSSVLLPINLEYNWKINSFMVRFLEDIDKLPNYGEQLALCDLINLKLKIEIENPIISGAPLSTISKLKKL